MLTAFGLYTHIRGNRIRSIAMLGALCVLVYALIFAGALIGEAMTHNWGLPALLAAASRDLAVAAPWATLGVGLWTLFAYRYNQSLIGLAAPASALTRAERPDLYNMLENLCVSRGMAMPKLMVLDEAAPNAFATGVNDAQYSITLTTGLLDLLDEKETEAVIAHELTHIRNGDVRMMIFAVIIAGVVAFFAEIIFRMWARGGWGSGGKSSNSSDGGDSNNGKGSGGAAAAIAIAMLIVAAAWVASLGLRLALSRSREFLADAGSVELTKNPDAMISALRKIEGRGEIETAPSAIMEMCLDNPRTGFADLFSTHPSIDARVAALVAYAGGHDAPPPASVADRIPPPPESGAGPWGPAA